MDIIGKTDAVLDWAKGWPELDGMLKLNALDAETVGDASLITDYNDYAINEYIDGTADRYFTVELRMVLGWSDGFDVTNAEAARLMESWMEWVSEQYPRNVPDFGAKASVTGISPLQNMPVPAMVYPDSQTAEYSFTARIYYTE